MSTPGGHSTGGGGVPVRPVRVGVSVPPTVPVGAVDMAGADVAGADVTVADGAAAP